MSSKALYTINFGGYDPLKEPTVVTPGWDYIVFSDTDTAADSFDVIVVDTGLPPHLAARDCYINSHKYLYDPLTLDWILDEF